jgi:hypothetical protein
LDGKKKYFKSLRPLAGAVFWQLTTPQAPTSCVDQQGQVLLAYILQFAGKKIPREVSALGSENVLVFTDACYEPGHAEWPCGLGGVLFACGEVFFYSVSVGTEIRTLLGEGVKKQIIFEVETLAALLAALLWRTFCGNKRVVLFVDNEGTKFALLKGLSDNLCVDAMAEKFACLESELHTLIWIARVPSKSNVADPPSRGITDIPVLANATDMSSAALELLTGIITQIFNVGETAA